MIEGVKVKRLKVIPDKRGRLMEILRVKDTKLDLQQVYLTTAYEGIVKDRDYFHMHKRQTDCFCCVKGRIRLVLVDTRKKSSTKGDINEFDIGEANPCLVIIPKGVLHAFKSLKGESFVINCIDREYNRIAPDEFRIRNEWYGWEKLRRLR